jgi:hypothetical protein
MKNVILAAVILATLFCVPAAQAVTKLVGHSDKVIIFYDNNNDSKYEKIELIVFAEPTRVITADEAKAIIDTFPEGTE